MEEQEKVKNEIQEIIMSETSYKNEINKKSNQEIVYSHYNDFDSDKTYEMFAIVGESSKEKTEEDVIRGEIWFVNQQGAYKIEELRDYWMYPKEYLFGKSVFIAFEEHYTTGAVTYLWGVQDGKPFQPSLTAKANGFRINKYNEVVITNSAYDAGKMIPDDWKVLPDDELWAGHTYNQYYYFWNGDSFKEYGAIEITVDELLKIDGTSELIEYIKDLNATINEIYYRNNNIIQINYQIEEHLDTYTLISYYFIMFRYEGSKIKLKDCTEGEGNILKVLNTSLAVYPDEFNIDKIKADLSK